MNLREWRIVQEQEWCYYCEPKMTVDGIRVFTCTHPAGEKVELVYRGSLIVGVSPPCFPADWDICGLNSSAIN